MFSNVLAATIFEDSFETYDLGDLTGQGDWLGSNQAQVVDSHYKEGSKSAYFPATDTYYHVNKTGTETCVGSVGFWFKILTPVGDTDNLFTFLVRQETEGKITANIRIGGDWTIQSRIVEYQDSDLNFIFLGNYSLNIWYPVDIEWNCNIKQVRFNFNNTGWTDWVLNRDNTNIAPTTLLTEEAGGKPLAKDSYFYFDWIAETSKIPSCSLERCDLCSQIYWFAILTIHNCFDYTIFFIYQQE
ncbi:unnamed protein product [marine sediment metagenome]|uniref:Uncharacterized protein n=1 Tax=marine sediment metagenome TaxID=412755 RepID=X1PE27_9ZZZZ